MIDKEITLGFAEWTDLQCIRNNEHEWKYRGDNYKTIYSTEEIFDLYLKDINCINS